MDLVPIEESGSGVRLALAYATAENITGAPIYRRALAYLHRDAAAALERAVAIARPLGLTLQIWDAYRPTEAQYILWRHSPDPTFLVDPRKGSPHSRGVAVDLTLLDATGRALEMGTAFDAFTPSAHHADRTVSIEAQRNRLLLLGLMSAAGWDFYSKEWWHYQLFDARRYPLYSDTALPHGLMHP